MSEKAFNKLWTVLAALTLIFAALAWLRASGQAVKADNFGILGRKPEQTPILTIPVLSLMIVALAELLRRYRRAHGGQTWSSRIPLFYFDKTDVVVGSTDGRWFQGGCLGIFLALPLASLLAVFGRFLRGHIYCDGKDAAAPHEIADRVLFFPSAIRCDTFGRFAGPDGPQYYIWTTPWIYSGLIVISLAAVAIALMRVFRGSA